MKKVEELSEQQEDKKTTFREELVYRMPQRQHVIGHNPHLGYKVRGSGIPPKGVIVTRRSSSYGGEFWEGYPSGSSLEPLRDETKKQKRYPICKGLKDDDER